MSRISLILLILGGLLVVCGVRVWPNFRDMGMRAKRAEGIGLLTEIHRAELAWFDSNGRFASAGATPARPPGKSQTAFESDHLAEWKALGWLPEGMVRCQYEVELTAPDGSDFRATARCDVDGDGRHSVFEGTRDILPRLVSPPDQW
jgi:hypothetical protein